MISSNRIWWFAAAVWFVLCHYILTVDVWKDPSNRVPGPVGDNMVMLWNLGWVKYALNNGTPGFWFPNAYYDQPFLFLFSTHTWLNGVLGWIFSPVLPDGYQGTILWANISMAITSVATGLLLIGCLKAWGVRFWPILLMISSMVTFCWFRLFALTGHYHFFETHWMLLSLLFACLGRLRFINRDMPGGYVRFGLAGFFLGVAALNDQTMAVFTTVLLVALLVSLTGIIYRKWATLLKITVSCFVPAVLVALIHLIPVIMAVLNGSFEYSVDKNTPRLVDATSLLIPPDISRMGERFVNLRHSLHLVWAEGTYLGVVSILSLGFATIYGLKYVLTKRGSRPGYLKTTFYSMGLAWFFILLALGDSLVIGSDRYAALPGRVLKAIPVINNIRMPQRWIWPAQLCIALSSASLLNVLYQKARKQIRWWICLPGALLPIWEGQMAPRIQPVDFRNDTFVNPPGIVRAVQNNYRNGSVLMMPVEAAYAHGNIFQFLWGYDIPLTLSYTARMPVKISEIPWEQNHWTEPSEDWLTLHGVQIIVFPFTENLLPIYSDWLREAKRAVPSLQVFGRFGGRIKVP